MTRYPDLVDEIHAAFPAARPDPFVPITGGSRREEPLATAAAFADKLTWTELDAAWLDAAPDGWGSALHFLSPGALAFYIPAYMLADLDDALLTVDVPFSLTWGFARGRRATSIDTDTDWWDYYDRHWASLTDAQCLAVVHYLETLVARGDDISGDTKKALANYWYQRVGRCPR